MLLGALTWLFDPEEPIVRQDLPAPPGARAGWLQPIALGILLFSIVAMILRRRRARRLGIEGIRTFAFGAAVGNVLFDLSAVLTPDRPAAESIRDLEETPERDDLGDGRDPTKGDGKPPASRASP